ncbi:MAG: CusA/CzcA family heavy metal efflux RND transporter [Bacteroidales bacterium]|nr:CusA/CzcA family heavy metal efflux RND transporter [Bacteroidales bacterium]
MFRSIIKFSVEQKPIIAFLILVLIGFGIYSMQKIPIDAVPDITNNQVQIVTTSPSLSPQEIERFITYPLEIAMANITDVIEIRSISRYGLSVITVVFKDKVPILHGRQLVSEILQQAKQDIPEFYDSPEMLPITTGLGEIFQYTLKVDSAYKNIYSPMKLREIQDWIVKRQLSGIPGIVEISSFGGFLKQYEIAVDPILMRSFNLTCADIYEAVNKNNQSSGGSYIEKSEYAFYIRTEGLLENIHDIENIVVCIKNGVPVLVSDLAKVKLGYAPRFGAMTKNGQGEAVGGITLMLKGANSSKVISEVKERIEKVQPSLPAGVSIEPYLDRSELVKRTTNTVAKNLVEGGLIVIFILVILLGNYRSGLIVASVIPLSLLFGFILMHLFGVSANLMSLGAIDFGIVIDGAVIIVESILYYIQQNYSGKTLDQKKMDTVVTTAAGNIYHSAAFGVLIILVVFIPIITLTGIEGKNFRPMAQTFSFVILGAFFLSMTYVPMMSALFLKKKIISKRTFSDKIIRLLKYSYHPILKFSIRYKLLILIITFLVFVASIISFPFLGGEFVPTLEEGDLAMQMTVPAGSSLSQSIKMSTRAEKILLDNFPEVEQVVSKIGTAEVPTDPMAVEDADIMIVLKDKKEWVSAKSREELIGKMKDKLSVLSAASFEFTQPIQLRFNELMTGIKSDIAIVIYGDDIDELFKKAKEASKIIEGLEGAADIRIEQITGLPQYIVKYNRDKIAKYSLNIEQLNRTITTAYSGTSAGVIFENDRKFDIVLRMDEKYRDNLDLSIISAVNPEGKIIPLSEVADIKEIKGPMQISRDDTRRRVTVGINVRNRDIASLVSDIDDKLKEEMKLKPGYYIEYGGQFENLENARKRLMLAVPVALLLILILLFFTFNSFKYALLIFTAVPLSAVGGIAALWIRGIPFSISAGVGFIALFGVAVLNGIVLISYYRQMHDEGISNVKYIVIKGACTRLRPVLMTASTDILGFLPMAISVTAGAEVQRPLATVVIGGIITSTMLTLIILPILYLMMNSDDGINFKIKRLKIITPLILLGLILTPAINAEDTTDYREITIEQAVDSALTHNLRLKNAQLNVERSALLKSGAFDLYPTELNYEFGQINSELNDRYLEINQNFGSLMVHGAKLKKAKIEYNLQTTAYKLEENRLKAEVKSAYLFWQYLNKKVKLLKDEAMLYQKMDTIMHLRYINGDVSLLNKEIAKSKVAEITSEYFIAVDDLQIALNKLKQLMNISQNIKPEDHDPAMYMIYKNADISVLDENTTLLYYKQKHDIALAEKNIAISEYFPEFSAGYFNQTIDNIYNLHSWQIGLSVPLWIPEQQSKIKQAKIESEIAANNLEYQNQLLRVEIENLLFESNKYFKQIRYYQNNALPQAELLINIAKIHLETEEINYLEFLQSISIANQIKQEYYRTINDYNQTILQLELYGN